MSAADKAEKQYRQFTGKLATIYGLEPKEKYFCSLTRSVPYQDLETEMDLMLDAIRHRQDPR